MSVWIPPKQPEEMHVIRREPLLAIVGPDTSKNMRRARIEKVAIGIGRLNVDLDNAPKLLSDLARRAALLAAIGLANDQIGALLHIGPSWTKNLLSSADQKLEVSRRSGLGRRLFEIGVLTIAEPAAPLRLSQSERNVVNEVSYGYTDKEAAGDLRLSPITIKSHLGHITARTNIHDRSETILHSIASGEIGEFYDRDILSKQQEPGPTAE